MEEPLEGAVLALRLRVVRHGNDDLRLELMDDLGGLRGGQVDVGARDRNEDDVDVPDALEVGGRQLVAEVAQVADDEVVEPDGEDGVTSARRARSEEHTSELQSRGHLVCRLLLEKKKKK